METEETKKDGKCCSKGACCGCKALVAVALLAIGAVGGYFCGRHCAASSAATAVSAPANPAK
ncbi:MAG TPA: hypothetical protein VNK24_04120 [Elusimicrobiota bacterium]|nr:hypothetical protein [Elusimicrobiota bacterium]